MSRSIGALLVVFTLMAGCSSSGGAPTSTKGASLPRPSAIGTSTGAPVSIVIGATGGSVASADGLATVTIPAGALAGDTSIGIQPVTNTAAGGRGVAYRLMPEGQGFTRPVRLTFHYSAGDLAGTFAEALGVAYQDAAGRWEWQDSAALDVAARTVSVMSTHFSIWSLVRGAQLTPSSATVKFNGKATFTAISCTTKVGKGIYVKYLCSDLSYGSPLVTVVPGTWAVDGAPGGTTGHGLVTGDTGVGVYTAPATRFASTSSRLIVAVSVQAKTAKGVTTLLASNVTILSGFRVLGQLLETNSGNVCAAAISTKVTDAVTFTVLPVGDTYRVTDLSNSDTVYDPAIIPELGIPATMIKKPDVFFAKSADVQPPDNSDYIDITLKGTLNVGSCSYKGVTIGLAKTFDVLAGLAFHANDVPATGSLYPQSNIIGDTEWTWNVSLQ